MNLNFLLEDMYTIWEFVREVIEGINCPQLPVFGRCGCVSILQFYGDGEFWVVLYAGFFEGEGRGSIYSKLLPDGDLTECMRKARGIFGKFFEGYDTDCINICFDRETTDLVSEMVMDAGYEVCIGDTEIFSVEPENKRVLGNFVGLLLGNMIGFFGNRCGDVSGKVGDII